MLHGRPGDAGGDGKKKRPKPRAPASQTEFFVYSQLMFFVWCVERESDSLLDPPENAKLFPNIFSLIVTLKKKSALVLSLFL